MSRLTMLNNARDILAKLHYENIDLCFDEILDEIDEDIDYLEKKDNT